MVMNGSNGDNFRNASQMLRDYMPFVRNGEDIQQMINAFAVVIDRYVKLIQSDIGTFFQQITVHALCQIFLFCVCQKRNENFQ